MRGWTKGLVLAAAASLAAAADGPPLDEWTIKRKEIFEFVEAPRMLRRGDRVEISFTSKDFCDVTVAVEDGEGGILRHLASGVLGANAPEPFQKNSLSQTIVWDGKDERGRYAGEKENCVVRVSLGLKPVFERTLYWAPERRIGSGAGLGTGTAMTIPVPLIQPAPEGVYVFEGYGTDHLRLFDHDGHYVRTIYPFPADRIDGVQGVNRAVFPQDGLTLPFKIGYVQATLLNSGTTASTGYTGSRQGTAAVAMAVRNGRIALAHKNLNRLSTDGSTGGLPLYGPQVTFPAQLINRKDAIDVSPTSAAFSPDGKILYLTGYFWREGIPGINLSKGGHHGVVRMDFEKDGVPVVFLGSMKLEDSGADNAHFADPASVGCDGAGRVYVADFFNDRIQVFTPDGKFYKTLSTPKPARVTVHPKTGEIYVFSWAIQNTLSLGLASQKQPVQIDPAFSIYGPIEKPEKRGSVAIPFVDYAGKYHPHDKWGGLQYGAAFDPWADPPTLWVVSGKAHMTYVSAGGLLVGERSDWERWGVRLHAVKGSQVSLRRDFGAAVSKSVVRQAPPTYLRQRLYVNPKNRKLYVAEHKDGQGKSFDEILEIDPATGGVRMVNLPFAAEDLAFDLDGAIYLRSLLDLARYNPETWREIPFDYGEERDWISWTGKKSPPLMSVIPLYTGTLWHKGGLWISPKGHIAVSCYNTKDLMPHIDKRTDENRIGGGSDPKKDEKVLRGAVYVPRFFPGRNYYGQIHIYDRHGKRIHDDEIPGIAITDGLFIDQDDSSYVLAGSTRTIGGKPYFSDFTGTLMKFKRGRGRMISTARNPIPLVAEPERPPDVIGYVQGRAWVEDAEWMYGGVGYAGRAYGCHRMDGYTCACANTRFALDYFKRSFAPEFDRYKVAVLDTNGNLILRIGQSGNADDGKPLVAAGGPPRARSIGGDETALFYPVYLATDTDRRLFIADPGNARIASVRLGYYREARVPLKNVPDVTVTTPQE